VYLLILRSVHTKALHLVLRIVIKPRECKAGRVFIAAFEEFTQDIQVWSYRQVDVMRIEWIWAWSMALWVETICIVFRNLPVQTAFTII
jgi:hypothetical protein